MHRREQCVLVVLLVDEQRDVVWLNQPEQRLLLFEFFDAALLDEFENYLRYLLLQVHGRLHRGLFVFVIVLGVAVVTAALDALLSLHEVLTLFLGEHGHAAGDLSVDDDAALVVVTVHLVVVVSLEVALHALRLVLVVLEVVLLVSVVEALHVGHVVEPALVLVVLALVSVVALVV